VVKPGRRRFRKRAGVGPDTGAGGNAQPSAETEAVCFAPASRGQAASGGRSLADDGSGKVLRVPMVTAGPGRGEFPRPGPFPASAARGRQPFRRPIRPQTTLQLGSCPCGQRKSPRLLVGVRAHALTRKSSRWTEPDASAFSWRSAPGLNLSRNAGSMKWPRLMLDSRHGDPIFRAGCGRVAVGRDGHGPSSRACLVVNI
jgi:hypothetical protein